MTAPRIALACRALVVGLSLSAVVGCSGLNFLDSGVVSAPTSYSLEGTMWAGRYNDSNGRGNGTLTIVFDRARDSRGLLYGNWVTTFPDATRNVSGPVQLYPHFSSTTADDVSLQLGTPHFNVQASPGRGCWMTLFATVSGSEMTGGVNTGVNICDPAETKRLVLVTLSQQ